MSKLNEDKFINPSVTCDGQEDRHANFWLCVYLALVLSHVPQLGVFDLQGPGVRECRVQAREPGVTSKGDHIACKYM